MDKGCKAHKVGCKVWRADGRNVDGEGATGEQVCGMSKGRGSQRADVRNVDGEGAPGEQTCSTSKEKELSESRHSEHQRGRRSQGGNVRHVERKEFSGSRHLECQRGRSSRGANMQHVERKGLSESRRSER